MPITTKTGVLIKTDVATKIYLVQELEKQAQNIVIMDIDDRHLFIKKEYLNQVSEKVQRFKEEHAWEKQNKGAQNFQDF